MKNMFFAVWLALIGLFVMESMTETQAQTAAGNADRAQSKRASKLAPSDQQFLREAYERGLFEIGAAQLAMENSSVLAIHLLARQIVVNRAEIHEQLKAFADTKGMAALSDQLDSGHRQTLERLSNASEDDDFDLRYCGTVVSGHLRDIKALQSAAARGSDPDFRALADAIISNLKQDLEIALAIQRALASARNEGATIDV